MRSFLLALGLGVFLSCCATEDNQLQIGSAQNNQAPPLLLTGEEYESTMSPLAVAGNERCAVCHMNYRYDDLAKDHAWQDIGCADCHGESDEHVADESWASGGNGTPPEKMFRRREINKFCVECHPKDEIDGRHESTILLEPEEGDHVCTDCHGDHRLEHRTCEWK